MAGLTWPFSIFTIAVPYNIIIQYIHYSNTLSLSMVVLNSRDQ